MSKVNGNDGKRIPQSVWKTMSQEQRDKVLARRKGVQPRNRSLKKKKKRFGQEVSEDIIAKASGASGTDTRVGSREVKLVGTSSISVPTTDQVLDVLVRITQRSLAYLAMGTVLRAIQRGWLTSPIDKDACPFYAWRYLIDTYKNSMLGTFPTMQTAPLWFWEINASLMPKTERVKTGKVAYQPFFLDDGQGVDIAFPLGTGDYSYSIYWGLEGDASLPLVNGYVPLVPPNPYTLERGEQAIQRLFEFFSNEGLCKRVAAPDFDKLWMMHDTSAFAACYAEMGQSFFNPCGTAVTAQSERRITSPMFAKFSTYQDGDEGGWRGWHEYHRTAGSPAYLSTRVTELFLHRQLRNKCSPIIKWFNFDEFFEVLSLTLCLAIENHIKGGQTPFACPLTAQQVQLMLRQAMLPFFCNDMVQDLRLTSPSWIPFLPFTVGPNGVAVGTSGSGPLLPRFLAENIRCCKRIVAKLRSPKGENAGMELDLIPVLGRPAPSVFSQLGNYYYNDNIANLLYTVDVGEVPINFVDASAVVGPSTVYLNLNGKNYPLLVEIWNAWIQQYSGTLVSLVQLSSDRGCEALATLPYTNVHRYTPEVGLQAETPPVTAKNNPGATPTLMDGKGKLLKRGSVKNFGTDMSKFRKQFGVGADPLPGPSTLFSTVVVSETTSTLGFTSELWRYLSLWVLPVVFVEAPTQESSLAAYQTNVVEPFRLGSTSNNTTGTQEAINTNYPFVLDRHKQFAAVNVRAWNSPVKSEMEEEFDELTSRGDGGFFTKLAGVIGESLGISGSAEFMNNVGDLTGL